MMAFNPFEGGPARKAPKVDPRHFYSKIHCLAGVRSGGVRRGGKSERTLARDVLAYMRARPGQFSFDLEELSDHLVESERPLKLLSAMVRARQIQYHPESTNSAKRAYVRAGDGVDFATAAARLPNLICDVLRAAAQPMKSSDIHRLLNGDFGDDRVRSTLNTLGRRGIAVRTKDRVGIALWALK